jgi:putative transcriptional regulator
MSPLQSSGTITFDGIFAGQILTAAPILHGTSLEGTVFLICSHTAQGTMALQLNLPAENPTFENLLDHYDIPRHRLAGKVEVMTGGPVEPSRGLVIHSGDWISMDSARLSEGIHMSASLDVLRALGAGTGPGKAVLFLGRAQWAPGNLEKEVCSGAWINVRPSGPIIFGMDHSAKWAKSLLSMHVDPARLSAVTGRA